MLDVKSLNMAIGNLNGNRIFFFDFAFSEFYVDALGAAKKREQTTSYRGTPEYMAWWPLNGFTATRADDLISFGINLLDLNHIELPWLDKTEEDQDIEESMEIVREEWTKKSLEVSFHFQFCFDASSLKCQPGSKLLLLIYSKPFYSKGNLSRVR